VAGVNGERPRSEGTTRTEGRRRGQELRRRLDHLGIGPFGAIAGVLVLALFVGLYAIDGLLARAARDQREAAADYLQAITQRTADETHMTAAGARESLAVSVSRSLEAIRERPTAVGIVIPGYDTVFVPEDARPLMSSGNGAHRPLRLQGGGRAELLVMSGSTAGTARASLWVIGLLGILLVAVVGIRARQRALQIAARSADIERLSREALHANAMKSEFLANVSHELRTPLTAIVGFVEMLRDGVYGELAPRQVGPVDRIAASATHLRQLVDQILDIARIAAGRLEVSREVISLRPYVLNIASELESLFAERSLRLSISVPATLPRVRTDATHLRHILVNLLGNAVKYTPAGSVAIRTKVLPGSNPTVRRTPDDPSLLNFAPDRDASWLVLQVADTGIGIPERDHERIFDEFEQVNAGPRTDSSARGTGLGLAISRRLARALGGDITLQSAPGKGSTFSVWLPLELADLHARTVQTTNVGAPPEPTS
jgi:two-component system sensor histidine kinase EvgS